MRISTILAVITILGVSLSVVGDASGQVVAHWRFDDDSYTLDTAPPYGSGVVVAGVGSVVSSTVAGSGNPGPGPIWRSDVPVATVPLTGESNVKCLELDVDNGYTYESTGMVQVSSGYTAMQFSPVLGHNQLFTAQCWIKKDAGSVGGFRYIFAKIGGYAMRINSDGTLSAAILQTNANDALVCTTQTAIDNQWHHVAAIFDTRSGNNSVRLFVDGIEDSSITYDAAVDYSPSVSEFNIGAYKYGNYAFEGKIDELQFMAGTPIRFLNNALVPSPPPPGEVAYWSFDDDSYGINVAPAFGSSVVVTGSGSVASDTVAGSGNPGTGPVWKADVPALTGQVNLKSLELDVDYGYTYESTGFVQVPSGVTALQFNPSSGASGMFTAQCWIKKDPGSTSGSRNIFVKIGGYCLRLNTDNTLSACILRTNSYDGLVRTSTTVIDDQWHHVAAVYDTRATQNAVSLFIDGVEEGAITYDSGIDYIPVAGEFIIGGYKYGDYAYEGKIDEVRLTEGALTPDEFAFGDPREYYTTLVYWRFDNDGNSSGSTAVGDDTILDEIGVVPGDPYNGPVYSSDVPVGTVPQSGELNSLSMDFDASDYIDTWAGYFSFYPEEVFTVEFYIKPDITGAYQTIFWKQSCYVIGLDTSNSLYAGINRPGDNSFFRVDWPTTLEIGRWYSVAVIYYLNPGTDANIRLIVDGIESSKIVTDQRSSYDYVRYDGKVQLGAYSYGNYGFDGKIDEFRVTAGEVYGEEQIAQIPEHTLEGDVNRDGVVDLNDMRLLTMFWLE